MKKLIKFSKNYLDIHKIKKNLFKSNNLLLKEIRTINKIYIQQKKRTNCKICQKKLLSKTFQSHLVKYSLCNKCGHLNGYYNDSKSFNERAYNPKKNKKYYNFYKKDFKNRVKNINLPKLDFLKRSIKLKKFKILEIGSGSGAFIKACEEKKIDAQGIEINKDLVLFSKKILKKNSVIKGDEDSTLKIVQNSKREVLVLLSSLEHLSFPIKLLESFERSKMQYLYICVPLFSFSVLLELIFQNSVPRVLGGPHTHLFTEKSINFISKKYKLKIISEWWFGQDIPDMFRMFSNSLNNNPEINFILNNFFLSSVNELQNIVDKKKFCSQVHVLFKKS